MQNISFQSSLSLLPMSSHTVLHLFLSVQSIQIKCSFLFFRIKAGKEQNPPHTDQRGVFPRTERGLLGTGWTDNPWSSYAVLCTNWTDSSFFHRTYKVLTSKELCCPVIWQGFLYWAKTLSIMVFTYSIKSFLHYYSIQWQCDTASKGLFTYTTPFFN